jgi:hypothetical protein
VHPHHPTTKQQTKRKKEVKISNTMAKLSSKYTHEYMYNIVTLK